MNETITLDKFEFLIRYMTNAKGPHHDKDKTLVWYDILVHDKKYTEEMIVFARQKILMSDIRFPEPYDFIKIIEPSQDPQISASNDLDLHINPQANVYSTQLARDTFDQLFNSKAEYLELTGDKKRWGRKELIELYIRNKQEETRLMQIETVKNKMIGDGKC